MVPLFKEAKLGENVKNMQASGALIKPEKEVNKDNLICADLSFHENTLQTGSLNHFNLKRLQTSHKRSDGDLFQTLLV